jgi:hypothetical protein
MYLGDVAKILTFQTNTYTKSAVNRHPERLDSKIFNFALQGREVVVNSDLTAVALSFPEAWRPFVVLPSAQLTHS